MCHIRKHSSQQINIKNWPWSEELWSCTLQGYSPVGMREGGSVALCISMSWCLQSFWESFVEIKVSAHLRVKPWALGVFSAVPLSHRHSLSLPLIFLMRLQQLGLSKCWLPFVTPQASSFSCDPHTCLCNFIWVENDVTQKKTTTNHPANNSHVSALGTHTWVLLSWPGQRLHAVQSSMWPATTCLD